MAADISCRDDWRYVLSAGRTGTVFLHKFISTHLLDVTAIHEPPPSRYQMMLANMRNDWGIGHQLLRTSFQRSRLARHNAAMGIYVEINPFLCPLTDLLPDVCRPLRVVHMVREPATWARSMLAFKASQRLRWLIDYVPFAKPYPAPRPSGWRQLNDFEKTLWRWNWCNERILRLRDACSSYVVVRYEDLFSNDFAQRNVAIKSILDTLDLPTPESMNWEALDRVNIGPRHSLPVDWEATQRICGALARVFHYSYGIAHEHSSTGK